MKTEPLAGRAPASGDGDGSFLLEWTVTAVFATIAGWRWLKRNLAHELSTI